MHTCKNEGYPPLGGAGWHGRPGRLLPSLPGVLKKIFLKVWGEMHGTVVGDGMPTCSGAQPAASPGLSAAHVPCEGERDAGEWGHWQRGLACCSTGCLHGPTHSLNHFSCSPSFSAWQSAVQ